MHGMRRLSLVAILAVASILQFATSSLAQPWPQRTVRAIVPFPPGSSPDIAARVFGERLSTRWGQAVVVENAPGADGFTGTVAFAVGRDDHSILFAPAAPISAYPLLHEKLPYDPARDAVPVVAIADTSGAIAVPASLPVATLSEFVNYANTRPNQLNWATGGGAFPILISGLLKVAKLDLTQVPYRSQNVALQDLGEGRIQMFATPMTVLLPLVQARKIRVLAVTNKTRSPLWPDVPTIAESGYPDFTFDGLIGVFAPRDTPGDRLQRLSAEIQDIAADQTVAQRLRAAGQIVRQGTRAEFDTAINEQRSKLAAILQLVGNKGSKEK